MRVAYFDCFAGISGETVLGALLDAGLSLDAVRAELAKLPPTGYGLEAQRVTTQGVTGTQVVVTPSSPRLPVYTLSDAPTAATNGHYPSEKTIQNFVEAVGKSDLPDWVKPRAITALGLLGKAAEAHGTAPDMGAVTAVLAAVCALALLGVESVICSPLNVGGGYLPGKPGLPQPTPEVAEVLRSSPVPVYGSDSCREMVNLSGAALAASAADSFGLVPVMTLGSVGYSMSGAPPSPGMRVLLGEIQTGAAQPSAPVDGSIPGAHALAHNVEMLSLIEANLGDTNPQYYDYIMDRLVWQGAQEVFFVPLHGRQNTRGALLSVVCKPETVEALSQLVFEETSACSLRISDIPVRTVQTEIANVETRWGQIKVRVGHNAQGKVLNVKPDYEDVKRVALEANVPIDHVYEEARAAWNPGTYDGHQQAGRQRRPSLQAAS